MEKSEVTKSLSTLTGKSIDKMSDKEKKEALNNILENIDELGASKRINKAWGQLSEQQKLNIYNDGDVSGIRSPLKNTILSPKTIIDQFSALKDKGIKTSFRYTLLKTIAPACRFCVELGILDKPEGLNEEQLIKDVKKDAKHIKNSLTALDLACYAVPELKPIQPYIKMIKPYVKWYKKHGTEVLISRLNKKNSSSVVENTNKRLLSNLSEKPNHLKVVKRKNIKIPNTSHKQDNLRMAA